MSVAIDLKDPRGRELALGLAARADVVVENFRPGVAERLGLSYEPSRREPPARLLLDLGLRPDRALGRPHGLRRVHSGPLGADEPHRGARGAPVRRRIARGRPHGRAHGRRGDPVGPGGAGQQRRGQYVDTSMLDSMVGMLTYLAGRWFMTGEDVTRVGSGHPSAVPYGAYPTADGHIVLATLYDSYWPTLCRAVGRPGPRRRPGARQQRAPAGPPRPGRRRAVSRPANPHHLGVAGGLHRPRPPPRPHPHGRPGAHPSPGGVPRCRPSR